MAAAFLLFPSLLFPSTAPTSASASGLIEGKERQTAEAGSVQVGSLRVEETKRKTPPVDWM